MNVDTIKKKLSTYPIAELGKKYQFNLRSDAKVTFLAFLGSFYLSLNEGHSLQRWTNRLQDFLSPTQGLTKAGLQKRLGLRQLSSVQGFLKELLLQRLDSLHQQSSSSGWFSAFGRVLLEDSVCVKLNTKLFDFFPGSHSKTGQASTARLQVCLNLKNLSFLNFSLMSYRDNDQKFSSHITKIIKPNDLVIRDLGYFTLSSLRSITQKGAFFLTRFKYGVNTYTADQGNSFDLGKHLKRLDARGITYWDQSVLTGKDQQFNTRIIALRCPDQVAEARIRKARKNRHARANHSQQYYELLKWNIFLTNVSQELLSAEEAKTAYGYRWHIEMVFKVWKSKFSLQRIVAQSHIIKPVHAQLFFFLFLSYLLLFYIAYFYYFFGRVYHSSSKVLSLFGFADFLRLNLVQLIEADLENTLPQWIPILEKEACHQKRKGRPSQLELIFGLQKTQ